MSGQKKTRNHWVSPAYLRPFAADSKRKKIWTFSKNEGDPRLRPIRNVAVGFYLYAPRGPQGRDYSFEDRLASLEQLFGSPYWAGISTGYVDLCSPALRKALSLLAAVLYLRNPLQLAFTQDMHRSLVAFLSEHPGPPESVEIDGREVQLDPASWPAYRDAGEDDIRCMWIKQVGSAAWLAHVSVLFTSVPGYCPNSKATTVLTSIFECPSLSWSVGPPF